MAALVVDDVLSPWQPRAVEVRGEATTLDTGGKAIMEGFDDPIIRITPSRLIRTHGWLRSLALVSNGTSRIWPAHIG